VHDRLFAQVRRRLGDGLGERLARSVLEIGNATERNGHPKEIRDQLLDVALGQVVRPTAHRQHRLQPWPEGSRRHIYGQLCPGLRLASRADQAVQLLFSHGRDDPSDVNDLMPNRCWIRPVEIVTAAFTVARSERHHGGDLIRGDERAEMLLVSRLTPTRPPAGFGRSPRCSRWIR